MGKAATSLVIRISAEKDPNLDKALKGLMEAASQLGREGKAAQADLDLLAKALKELEQTSKSGAGALSSSSDSIATAADKVVKAETKKAEAVKKSSTSAKKAAQDEQKAAAETVRAVEDSAAAIEEATGRAQRARDGRGGLVSPARSGQTSAPTAPSSTAPIAPGLDETHALAKDTTAAFKELEDQLQDMGSRAGVGLGAVSVGLAAIAAKAASTAREFETFEAQLKTILGTATAAQAKFDSAKVYAAATPFDVKEIVAATVTLESYKQRSDEVLPHVAALAAGMSKSLEDTALVVGKAMSGSLEGFESLRNEYGISTRELAKYGAEVNKAGGILTSTAGQTQKARDALAKVIEVRFGEALADQAKTVSAAVSNAGDAVINFAAEVGEGVAPFVRLGAVITGKFFDALTAMPTVMKAGLGATLVLGAGVTGLGSIAIGTTLALFKLDMELNKLVVSNTKAAAATGVTDLQMRKLAVSSALASRGSAATGGALAGLGKMGSLFSRLTTILAPFGPLLGGISLIAGAGTIALNSYANAQEEMGRKVSDTSKTLTEQTFAARQVTDLLGEIGGESIKAALAQKTLTERSEALTKAIKELPVGSLADGLKKLGHGPEEMADILAKVQEQTKATKAELSTLIQERENISGAALLPLGIATDEKGDPVGTLKTKLDDVDQRIYDTMQNLKLLGNISSIFAPVNDTVSKATANLNDLATASQKALDFSRYADQVGGIDAITAAVADLQAQIAKNSQELATKNEPGDKAGILSRLRGGVEDASTKKALESQLNLYSAVEKAEKQLADTRAQSTRQRLADVEKGLAKEKALRDVSRQEEATALNQQIALAKEMGKTGEADYIRFLEQRKAKKAEWAKEDLDITKNALEQQLETSKSFIDRLEAEGAPQGEIVAAYDRIIARLKEWENAHKPVLQRNKELAQEVGKTMSELTNSRAGSATKQLDDELKALKDSMKAIGDTAVTNQQKLEAVARQVELVKKAQANSTKEVAEHEKILAQLGRERLALEQTITAQKLRQAGKETQLAIESLRQEIEMLQIQRDMGLDVDEQLIAKSAELREARIKDLELTYQAERETADDKIAVEREYQIARKNLEQEFTLDRQREAAKRVTAAKDEAKQIRDAQSSEVARPTQSDNSQPFSSGIKSSGFGSREDYLQRREERRTERDEERRQAFLRANPKAVQNVQEIDRKRAEEQAKREEERRKARGANSPFDHLKGKDDSQFKLPTVPEQYRAASPKQIIEGAKHKTEGESSKAGPQTVTDNRQFTVTVNLEGGGMAQVDSDLNSPLGRAVVAIVESKFKNDGWRDGGQGSWA